MGWLWYLPLHRFPELILGDSRLGGYMLPPFLFFPTDAGTSNLDRKWSYFIYSLKSWLPHVKLKGGFQEQIAEQLSDINTFIWNPQLWEVDPSHHSHFMEVKTAQRGYRNICNHIASKQKWGLNPDILSRVHCFPSTPVLNSGCLLESLEATVKKFTDMQDQSPEILICFPWVGSEY